jgi:SAM-dependent methyltransferase
MSPRPFDFLARHYNAMTGFPGRIDALARQVRPWIEEWGPHEVLDAGCGGGALMLALDRLGVTPMGLDSSEPMLRLALANSRAQGRRFRFCGSSFEMAGRLYPARFDAAFCIGNSIIGAPTDRDLISWLAGLHGALRPGGHLLLQLLNTRLFMLGLKSVIARRTVGNGEFVRAAIPDGDRLNFCAFYLGTEGETHVHISRWIPWDLRRVSSALLGSGFQNVEAYGSLERVPFEVRSSADLVVSAQRPLR